MGGLIGSVLLLAAMLVAPCAAMAQAAPRSDAETLVLEERARAPEARRHFEEGRVHYEAERFEEAVVSFEAAAALVPSADLWFNIARAHERLDHKAEAAEAYRRYLRDSVDAPGADTIEARIERLEREAVASRAPVASPDMGRVVLATDRPGAEIRLDGRAVDTEEPLTLEERRHALEVAEQGRIPFRADVRVAAGMTTNAHATLPAATEYQTVGRPRIATWVLAGLGVGALGASVGLGVHAVGLKRDGDLAGARDRAQVSDYATAAAITLGVGALVAYFLEGRASRTERVTHASIDP